MVALHCRPMRKTKILHLALCCAALTTGVAVFGETDTAQALLELLVKKGIVTPDEAQQLRSEVAAGAAQQAPAAPPAPAPAGAPMAAGMPPPSKPIPAPDIVAPLSFRIGVANFTPLGFMDFTTVYRTAQDGGDIGSSFGSVPYSNTANAQLSETRFSLKNSRLGLRMDSDVGDTKVLGYVETDFLGNAATNVNVASNSDVLRMRVFFADLKHGPWEFLAGQDWSMMTPNRVGISPMPGDIFYTQNVDTNYQVGLIWGRTPQMRVLYHADPLTFGLSLENPDQYVGSAITLPTGFNAAEVDNGSNGTATPNTVPDIIGKVAYDGSIGPGLPVHVDAAGLVRSFKINTFNAATGLSADATATGYGGSVNGDIGIAPGLLLLGNAFYADGGGRYTSTALGPDVIVTPADASGAFGLDDVRSWAGIAGAEWDVLPVNKIFAYYGMVGFGAEYRELANGSYVGYGYPGSSNSQNRRIDEYTVGDQQILWKNPNYGDFKILTQLSYLDREPFYVAPGTPSDAHLTMFFFDLRYDLP